MAAPASLATLLESLTESLSAATEATPSAGQIQPPADGVSLLDVKNELLLSYLQHLVFFILSKIRRARNSDQTPKDEEPDLNAEVVRKLVELRLYLEKGVHHLEDKLSHTLTTVIRAANDSERQSDNSKSAPKRIPTTATLNGTGSGSDVDSAVSEDDESEEDTATKSASAPNLNAFAQPKSAARGMAAASSGDKTGTYKAPKINPTVMPTTETRQKAERRPNKSRTMDEYIATELSAAPLAEPSIGTTIARGGRKMKTDAERRDEAARQEYEEMNLVRLPKKTKKDEAREARLAGRRMVFGGEEFRDLGEGVDRIERLTRRKAGSGGTKGLLERSRKRGLETVDGPRGSGAGIGEQYRKRLKHVDGKPRRKR